MHWTVFATKRFTAKHLLIALKVVWDIPNQLEARTETVLLLEPFSRVLRTRRFVLAGWSMTSVIGEGNLVVVRNSLLLLPRHLTLCYLSIYLLSVLQEHKGSETGNLALFDLLLKAVVQFFQQVRKWESELWSTNLQKFGICRIKVSFFHSYLRFSSKRRTSKILKSCLSFSEIPSAFSSCMPLVNC